MRILSLGLALILPAAAIAADGVKWECPEDLKPAALAKRAELQAVEHAVRDSSAEKPVRVEPTEIFDLAAHECHSGRTQAWRVFGEPSCAPGKDAGLYKVTYPYELSYRRAKDEAAMFREAWKEGSDGLWQVTFEKGKDGWTALGQREVLDLTGAGIAPKHPGGGTR